MHCRRLCDYDLCLWLWFMIMICDNDYDLWLWLWFVIMIMICEYDYDLLLWLLFVIMIMICDYDLWLWFVIMIYDYDYDKQLWLWLVIMIMMWYDVIMIRWRWSRMYSTIRSAMSARGCTALESLHRSSARTSCVYSTTASTVGRSSIHHRIGSFTSPLSRRAPTDRGLFRFAGAEQRATRLSDAVEWAVWFFFNSRDMKFTRLIDDPHRFGFLYRNFWGNRRLSSQKK